MIHSTKQKKYKLQQASTNITINWTQHAVERSLERDLSLFQLIQRKKEYMFNRLCSYKASENKDQVFMIVLHFLNGNDAKAIVCVLDKEGRRIKIITVISNQMDYTAKDDTCKVDMTFSD